ncbi:MAG: ArsB/NhaD family transporter [Candidatus Aadella gelida]|nr:ArsB/NhaD family transporter [Candidatus Aadella gelida]
MKAILSIIIFSGAYVLIVTEKVNKTIVAVLGASAVLFLKLITFEQAINEVDFNVIFLLIGMMSSVYILSKTGFFEFIAVSVARFAKGDPKTITILLLIVTAVLSAMLDNVTTIIMIVPITILIMQLLEVNPVPVIIMEAIASNIGGTATLIGDPPNILIGSQAGLSFNDFLVHLGPIVLLIFVIFLLSVLVWFRNSFTVDEKVKKRVTESVPALAITDPRNMKRSLIILGLMFIGFFSHSAIGVEPGIIALAGGMLMLVVCKCESEETLMRVEWGVIFFFIGMFMMIAALDVNGVISTIGEKILHFSGQNLFLVCIIVLWSSAIFSAVLDNIPFVIVMIPLIRHFVVYFSKNAGIIDPSIIHLQVEQPLWWALALGACLGGNGTLIGASANIVMSRISERNGYHISFSKFFKYGSVFTVQAMIICTLYIWLRYFHA